MWSDIIFKWINKSFLVTVNFITVKINQAKLWNAQSQLRGPESDNGDCLFCEILYLSLCFVHSSLMRERTLNAVSSILLSRPSSWLTIRCRLVTSRALAPWSASQNRSISERTSSKDWHTSLKSLCEGRMERGGLCSGRREYPTGKGNQFDRFSSWVNLA